MMKGLTIFTLLLVSLSCLLTLSSGSPFSQSTALENAFRERLRRQAHEHDHDHGEGEMTSEQTLSVSRSEVHNSCKHSVLQKSVVRFTDEACFT